MRLHLHTVVKCTAARITVVRRSATAAPRRDSPNTRRSLRRPRGASRHCARRDGAARGRSARRMKFGKRFNSTLPEHLVHCALPYTVRQLLARQGSWLGQRSGGGAIRELCMCPAQRWPCAPCRLGRSAALGSVSVQRHGRLIACWLRARWLCGKRGGPVLALSGLPRASLSLRPGPRALRAPLRAPRAARACARAARDGRVRPLNTSVLLVPLGLSL